MELWVLRPHRGLTANGRRCRYLLDIYTAVTVPGVADQQSQNAFFVQSSRT